MEGGAWKQNETFLMVLEGLLGKEWETINLGVGGTGLDNYYQTYVSEGRKFNPDIVVMSIFIGNDITPKMQLFELKNRTLIKKIPEKEKSISIRIRRWLATHSAAYKLSVLILSTWKPSSDLLVKAGFFEKTDVDIYWTTDRQMFLEGLKTTEILMLETDKAVEADNATLVILLIPAKEQVDDERYKMFYDNRNKKPYNGRFEAQKELVRFCRANGIICFDPLQEMGIKNKNNTYYWDIDGHFDKDGHKFIGEYLFRSLNATRLLDQ